MGIFVCHSLWFGGGFVCFVVVLMMMMMILNIFFISSINEDCLQQYQITNT